MSFDIDYRRCPVPRMTEAVERYVERGIGSGHFLTALMSNDLTETIGRADADNAAAIREWVRFVYNELPNGCHGSPDKVAAWMKHRGLSGVLAKAKPAGEEAVTE